MKRFKFNLESVLKYRIGIERQEKGVLSGLNAQLNELLNDLERLNGNYRDAANELEQMSLEGISVFEIRSQHVIIENIEFYIEKKLDEIEEQRKKISKQTAVVVRAMRDTKTMDKLKEIKYEEYAKEENKEHERFIEEFAAHQGFAGKTAGN
jgi:flagellar FliJ protein